MPHFEALWVLEITAVLQDGILFALFEYHLLTVPVMAFSAQLGTAGWPLQAHSSPPSYSGLTQCISVEGISRAFSKHLLIQEIFSFFFFLLIMCITSKHALDEECER